MPIQNMHKAQLGEEIAKGHAKFGRVAARRPYRDDEGTEGGAGLQVEEHPLLSETPVGAASDLTAIASQNSEITEEALDRVDELTPALQNQPTLQAELGLRYNKNNTPKPSPL